MSPSPGTNLHLVSTPNLLPQVFSPGTPVFLLYLKLDQKDLINLIREPSCKAVYILSEATLSKYGIVLFFSSSSFFESS